MSDTDKPLPPPTPIWVTDPARFQDAIAKSLDEARAGLTEVDPYRMLDVLVNLERNALECARIALSADGLFPTLHAGRTYWFEIAGDIAKWLRQRVGLPESAPPPREEP